MGIVFSLSEGIRNELIKNVPFGIECPKEKPDNIDVNIADLGLSKDAYNTCRKLKTKKELKNHYLRKGYERFLKEMPDEDTAEELLHKGSLMKFIPTKD